MYITNENEGLLDTLAILIGACALCVLLTIPAQIYALRRIKHLERLQTVDAEAEVERIGSLFNYPCRYLNPRVIIFAGTELFKAIYERLNRVVGTVAIIVCSLITIFWAWVKGLRRRSEEPRNIDVELGTHRADESGGLPPNRRDLVPGAANPPGEGVQRVVMAHLVRH